MPIDAMPDLAPDIAMDTSAPAPARMDPAEQSPELSVSLTDPMAGNSQEEDLLEIPAFLRRQAN
jgi:cell division protein FtsZ